MSRKRLFYLDSDVFIAAKNAYYAFSICPGFWTSLLHHHGQNRVYSIDRIQQEIVAGNDADDLVHWTNHEVPDAFFQTTDDNDVITAYAEVMLWAQRSQQYTQPAKDEFAKAADGWLVAYARVHPGIVVTNEQPQPTAKRRILLPDVCTHFNVECQNTFTMLSELRVKYEWKE